MSTGDATRKLRADIGLHDYGPGRCEVCGWTLARQENAGCVPGDCCYRPQDPYEQQKIRDRRNKLTLLKAVEERDRLREENATLRAELATAKSNYDIAQKNYPACRLGPDVADKRTRSERKRDSIAADYLADTAPDIAKLVEAAKQEERAELIAEFDGRAERLLSRRGPFHDGQFIAYEVAVRFIRARNALSHTEGEHTS